MLENEYGEAAVEVLDILNNTNQIDVKKIPQSFISFLTNIASKNYKVNFDHNKPIDELNVKSKTKEIMGFIYITWWCDDKEREECKKTIHNNRIKKEEKLKEIYNPENIFKQKRYKIEEIKVQDTKETNIVEYKDESIIKKIINKILNFLGIKNKN